MSGCTSRNQAKLVREGIKEEYGGKDGLDLTASKRKGYPVQAHHCICCSVIQKNNGGKLAELAIESGYDINNGKNNIFLPAKFGHMKINDEQRHRGGHYKKYYDYVDKKLNPIYQKHKDSDPCNDPEARKNINGDLLSLQSTIYGHLDGKKVWLYDWSKNLYNEDYREEGTASLTSSNQQSSSTAGLGWVELYPSGQIRRKLLDSGECNETWYKSKGFPVPGNIDV